MSLFYVLGGALLATQAQANFASQFFSSLTHGKQQQEQKASVPDHHTELHNHHEDHVVANLTKSAAPSMLQKSFSSGIVDKVVKKTMGLSGSNVASMACKMESYKHMSCRQRKAMAKTMLKSFKLKEQEKDQMRDVMVHVETAHDLCSVFASLPQAQKCDDFQSGCDALVKNLCEHEMLVFDGSCPGVRSSFNTSSQFSETSSNKVMIRQFQLFRSSHTGWAW